ncbi:hypothetical protein GY15_25845 [Delftia sp. 670]|nr:hypothetical protein GY15_25845 [Delftia sp. 670]
MPAEWKLNTPAASTVQTSGADAENVTARPEVAVATGVNVVPKVCAAGCAKSMLCSSLSVVKGTLATSGCTRPAPSLAMKCSL